MLNHIEGGVTAAKGFEAASAAAGIKYQGRDDMALVYSKKPCHAAGTFTSNVVKAAPVLWDKHVVEDVKVMQAVVVNAGIANACTGKEGFEICERTAEAASKALNIPAETVGVASTGVIGMQIDISKVEKGVGLLAGKKGGTLADGNLAARAIMTTDTKPKETAYTFTVGGQKATIGGMCKGSGMIHPNMCTLLCFITTDVNISQELLNKALKTNVVDTFNMVSVDGDTSTNDTVLLMSNGEAGNAEITEENDDYAEFYKALDAVMKDLSKMIAGDGEGCTCLFEVSVIGSDTKENARTLAKSVVTSSLTKAMIFGHDANCGRVLCALGYSGVQFDPEKVDVTFTSAAGTEKVMENGMNLDFDEEKATKILSEEAVTVVCDMKMGQETATAWGCDLTYDYVKINGDYRS